MFNPTPEQEALVKAAKETSSSLMVQAYAGSSKTTSLIMMANALPAVPSIALAFNFKIKKEMEAKLPRHFDCKTLNGLGHAAWGKATGKRLVVDDRKLGGIVSAIFKEMDHKGPKEDWDYVRRLVIFAMQSGLVPQKMIGKGLISDTDENWHELAFNHCGVAQADLIQLARLVLDTSIKMSIQGVISYDDQIYMSALFGGIFQKYAITMVDEAQDLSPLNHIQLSKVSPTVGRLIVVGDKHQSIYGFRGADINSMSNLRKLKKDWLDLTLSYSFRCPKVIVARQNAHVPDFKAWSTNLDGVFHVIRRPADSIQTEPFWSWKDIQTLRAAHEADTVAVVCKNNSPLFSTAFRLIRQGVGCVMLGRDIGKSLAALTKKIIPDADTPIVDCVKKIQAWIDNEVSIAMANDRDDKAEAARDKGYSLLAVIDSAQNVNTRADILSRLEEIFKNEYGLVTLSTIHKVKGLEFDLVVFLDPWRVPSKRALDDPSLLEQEMNLKYVAETRAKMVLVHANADDLVRF